MFNNNMTGQIYFNQKEIDYLNDRDFLLTKRKITGKIFDLLARVQEKLIPQLNKHDQLIPAEVLSISGKISKGENYGSLPYLILDCPRFFQKEDVFAIRTMFWWGNYCSNTLHLQGKYLAMYKTNMINNISRLRTMGNYYICINKIPWEYHFEESNYLPINSLSDQDVRDFVQSKNFVKISSRINFDQLASIDQCSVDFVNNIIKFLKN